jgi:hypothetical protein
MKKVLLVLGQLLILAAMAAATANGLVSSAASAEQEKTIKDPAENTAYQSALNTSDPMDKAAALEAFVARYPSGIVKGNALEQAMEAYQMAGNLARGQKQLSGRLLLMIPMCVHWHCWPFLPVPRLLRPI